VNLPRHVAHKARIGDKCGTATVGVYGTDDFGHYPAIAGAKGVPTDKNTIDDKFGG